MKKLLSIVLSLWVLISLCACLAGCNHEEGDDTNTVEPNDNTTGTVDGNLTNETNPEEVDIEVQKIGTDLDGDIAVKFTKENQDYIGIVNKFGEIFYYCHSNVFYDYAAIGNEAYLLTTYDDNYEKNYTLIGSDGQETVLDKTLFDKIIGYGGGLISVYKNTSTITTEEHSYGVLDHNGNWVKPLSAGVKLPFLSNSTTGWNTCVFEYYGDGIFIAYNYGNYMLFNTNTNQVITLSDCSIESDKFTNGFIYVKTTTKYSDAYMYSQYNPTDGFTSDVTLPKYFALYADGTFKEVPEFTGTTSNLLVNSNGEHFRIFDKSNNTVKEYTEYPAEIVSSISHNGDFGILNISGADGKDYFAVVNKNFNLITDPILGTEAVICGDRVIYKNGENMYTIIDANGKYIASVDQGITHIYTYVNGVALAENESGKCLLDANGKILTLKLKWN